MRRYSSVYRVCIGFVTAAFALLAGCTGGNGEGLPTTPPPPPPSTGPFEPTFGAIQDNVFTPNCATSGCHLGAAAPQGLMLDAANSYENLVGVPSSEVPTILRVAAGDPDNSYLIQKLEGTASVGSQMPLGGTPLEQEVIDVIRQWISDGALDNRTPSTGAVRVVSMTPAPDSDLISAPAEIVVSFDREVDAATVNSASFLLVASGGDGSFGDGNDIPIAGTISLPGMSPMSATMDVSGSQLETDTYRLTLVGNGNSAITDTDANALDGEFSGTFPSGDGTAGGNFIATFRLTAASGGLTFNEIQDTVFTPGCAVSGCHEGAAAPQGLQLTEGDAFSNLVNVPSNEVPSLLRVEPGNPDDSYLIQKLEGTAAVGSRMPLGGTPLDQNTIEGIRQWIAAGAVE